MGYVIAFILAAGLIEYAKEHDSIIFGVLGALILLGMGITAVDIMLKIVVAIVKFIWRPALIVAGIGLFWWLINFFIECYVKTRSEEYPKIRKLYEESSQLPKPSNIDLRKKPIILCGEELPEEVLFVEFHSIIQGQIDRIKNNYQEYGRIKKERESVLQTYKQKHKKIPFENYVLNRYARKITGRINNNPDTFNVKAVFSQQGRLIKVEYVLSEIEKYNDRYDELREELNRKRQSQKEQEENKRRQELQRQQEQRKQQEQRAQEEALRKENIKRERSKLSASLRYDVLKRDGFRCTICGRSASDGVTLHVDHIKPVSKGGKTEMSNLRTLCDYCNLGKSDKYDPKGRN